MCCLDKVSFEVDGMKHLDNELRMILEKQFDDVIKEPKEFEEMFRSVLRDQEIEPNLETILSFITGFLTGLIDGLYLQKIGRTLKGKEIFELNELLKRRAFELRQAFMSTRIE